MNVPSKEHRDPVCLGNNHSKSCLENQLPGQEGNIQKPFLFLVCYDTKKGPTHTKTDIRCV